MESFHLIDLRDGQQYGKVRIGEQVWMTENLKAKVFRNGDSILEARTVTEWLNAANAGLPAWSYFGNLSSNGDKFGCLYNWFAVNDSRGLAPNGWHIPDDSEWWELTEHLGGNNVAAVKMKSSDGWLLEGNGDNSSGFNAKPGSFRAYDGNFYGGLGALAFWWSASAYSENQAWQRFVDYSSPVVDRNVNYKSSGFAVRCVED